MAKMLVKDVRAARKRGLLNRAEAATAVQRAGGGRHRRTCPACGGRYLPPMDRPADPWCCGCCALAWGESGHSRMMGRGVQVVRLSDGVLGTIVACRSETEALVEFQLTLEKVERAVVRPSDVEIIANLRVEHFPRCTRACGGANDGPIPGGD